MLRQAPVLETNGTLLIACGQDALRIEAGEPADGVWSSGGQLAADLNLVDGMRIGRAMEHRGSDRLTKVLILGANGFIGSHLSERLLEEGGYEVHAMDLHTSNLEHLLGVPHFNFHEGDISINREWIEYHVRKCDVVLPLVAIATPIEYVRNPLRVFQARLRRESSNHSRLCSAQDTCDIPLDERGVRHVWGFVFR